MLEDEKIRKETTDAITFTVITKEEAKACRHRLERRWYRRLIELNLLLTVGVLAVVLTSLSDYKELAIRAWAQFEEEVQETMQDYNDEETVFQ